MLSTAILLVLNVIPLSDASRRYGRALSTFPKLVRGSAVLMPVRKSNTIH